MRLLVCLAAALAAFVAITAAEAQTRKATAQETKVIRDCFETKGGTTEANECIGLVATPCGETPEGRSNLGQADCYRVEAAIWDVILNATYKTLLNDLDANQERKLRDMQRAWISSRDKTCDFFHTKIEGSMAIPMSASCLMRETAQRALLLKTFTGL